MIIRKILNEEKDLFNSIIDHPLQSWEWGEFKAQTGMKVERLGVFEKGKISDGFQLLFRSIPKTTMSAGQLLKSRLPNKQAIEAIKELAEEQKAVFIKVEPNFVAKLWKNEKGKIQFPPAKEENPDLGKLGLRSAKKILFDPNSFILDISKSEEELLAGMHSKTRYNIRLAEKSGVKIVEKSDDKGLEIFIKLLQETLKRQKFYMHSPNYFRTLWKVLYPAKIAHILLAQYQGKTLGAWMIFVWKDKLYYPYGASSTEHRNLMASNLLCWEAIKFGKKNKCTTFDMWGSLGPEPDTDHPWYGFHRFKLGYGGDLVEFIGSWDLVINPVLYQGLELANSIRWKLLRLRRKLPF